MFARSECPSCPCCTITRESPTLMSHPVCVCSALGPNPTQNSPSGFRASGPALPILGGRAPHSPARRGPRGLFRPEGSRPSGRRGSRARAHRLLPNRTLLPCPRMPRRDCAAPRARASGRSPLPARPSRRERWILPQGTTHEVMFAFHDRPFCGSTRLCSLSARPIFLSWDIIASRKEA